MQELPTDHSALVYRYHEQLYRLALLVAGDAEGAAALVERAYRALPPEPAEAEAQLIRALLPRRPRKRERRRGGYQNLAHTLLDSDRAAALLDTLAAMPAHARLAVGLHYMRSLTADEIAGSLGEAAGSLPLSELFTRFRINAARAMGLVPADADNAALIALDRAMEGRLPDEEAIALRREVFEQPRLRAARDGLAEARDLLARALLALFAVSAPLALTERLLEIVGRHGRARRRRGPTWARSVLALSVLAVVAAIVLVPSWFAQRAAPPLLRAPTAAELIDAAIHRFDRASLQAGVLHEQYRVQLSRGPAYMIERWYDFAAPHRLAVSVSLEGRNGPPRMQIGSDGHSLVQYRYAAGDGAFDPRSVDAHVSEAEAQVALPLLRAEPSATYFSGRRGDQIDIAPLYLAQARAAGATFLGQTTMLGRRAFLLIYRTEQLPTQPARQPAPESQGLQVVLTIDAQTYALLDVALVAESAAESTALHPLQAQVFDIAASAPDDRFKLPTTAGGEQRSGLPSARSPEIPSELFISLGDALRRAPGAILAPRQLPSAAMRGLALPINDNGAERVVLIYEGEFQSLVLTPLQRQGNQFRQTDEERSAGDFRYRIVHFPGEPAPRIGAVVYRPDTPDERVFVMLVDEAATPAEREARLQQLIASLTPVTEQNLPAFQRNFYGPTAAGGQG